jgi:hypothetical protein
MSKNLSKKLSQLPGFKTSGDRAVTGIVMVLLTILALYGVGAYRDHLVISVCQAQGGIPIYEKAYREMPHDFTGGNTTRQEYMVYDRCGPNPQKDK